MDVSHILCSRENFAHSVFKSVSSTKGQRTVEFTITNANVWALLRGLPVPISCSLLQLPFLVRSDRRAATEEMWCYISHNTLAFFFLNVSTIHSAYRTIQWWTRCSASGRMNRWWHCSGRLQHIGMGRTPSASSPAKSHTACHWASGIWLDRILVLSPKFL